MFARMIALASVLLLGAASPAPQAPPSTDVYVAELDLSASPPRLANPRNVTDRAGYDNQPFFEPEGGGLLYTSSRDGQTDIYRIDLSTLTATQLTDTPESEYSPTVMPNGLEISAVRVESDGTQRLWAFRRDGSAPRLLLESIAPVGYHAWGNNNEVVLFVLGDPPTLQMADIAAGTAETIAADIGRSLHRVPGRNGFSFLQRIGDKPRVRYLEPATQEISDLGAPLGQSQDMAWTPDGRMIMADGSRLHVRRPEGNWQLIADLAQQGITGITRVAVNTDGNRIAWVAERAGDD